MVIKLHVGRPLVFAMQHGRVEAVAASRQGVGRFPFLDPKNDPAAAGAARRDHSRAGALWRAQDPEPAPPVTSYALPNGVLMTVTNYTGSTNGSPHITIAGQSAPGEGVQIHNWGIKVQTHDMILRHLRIRVGETKGPGQVRRVLGEQTHALNLSGMNVIADHCEIAYANDQMLNTYGTEARNAVTLQWSYAVGSRPIPFAPVTTRTPDDWPRGGFPAYSPAEAQVDSKHNGIPDTWEIAHDLSPSNCRASGRNLDPRYDNIQICLNSL